MENNINGNRCFRCRYYDAFYTKGVKKFNNAKCGWCSCKHEIVKTLNFCENYALRQKRYSCKLMAKYSLNDLLTEISELRKILEAENEENENL